MEEIWKDIPNYVGRYKASNFGRIKSVDMILSYKRHKNDLKRTRKGKILTPTKAKNGYLRVEMSINGEHKLNLVHRLIAQAFIPNPKNYEQINHIDGNKENNNVNNLEWCSCKMNMCHAWKNGLYKGKRVGQYKNGELIAVYDSILEASKSIGSKTQGQNISEVALGKRKKAFGFEWKYI
jgi:hypothetical protein